MASAAKNCCLIHILLALDVVGKSCQPFAVNPTAEIGWVEQIVGVENEERIIHHILRLISLYLTFNPHHKSVVTGFDQSFRRAPLCLLLSHIFVQLFRHEQISIDRFNWSVADLTHQNNSHFLIDLHRLTVPFVLQRIGFLLR